MGIHAGPLFGALGVLAGIIQRSRHRRGLPARDRAVRRRRRDGLAALARRGRPTSGPRTRSPATRPTTTSAAHPAPPACATACATSSTRRRTATSCSRRPSASSGRTSAGASTAPTCSSATPARSTPTTPSATSSCARELQRHLPVAHDAPSGSQLGERVNTPIVNVNTPKTIADDPQFQDRMPWLPARRARLRAAAVAHQARRRDAAGARRRRRPSASTPTRSCATCSATTTTASPSCERPARSADLPPVFELTDEQQALDEAVGRLLTKSSSPEQVREAEAGEPAGSRRRCGADSSRWACSTRPRPARPDSPTSRSCACGPAPTSLRAARRGAGRGASHWRERSRSHRRVRAARSGRRRRTARPRRDGGRCGW